jgi:hypothetical protein
VRVEVRLTAERLAAALDTISAMTAKFLDQFIRRPVDRPRPCGGPSADQTTSQTREHPFWNEVS